MGLCESRHPRSNLECFGKSIGSRISSDSSIVISGYDPEIYKYKTTRVLQIEIW